ncbi:hypothetical protein FJTKL_05714 [Diaporthe vaccinii]|uniref:Uncharacterized protein n=1 Tax=Diaporthe vaccinii TaxID=105482 RepID=A0ABR4DRB0_9PEZI
MSCPLCSNFRPQEVKNMAPGTKARVVRLILVKDLMSSDCDECRLMWEALQLFQSIFDDQSLVHVEMALDRPILTEATTPVTSLSALWQRFRPSPVPKHVTPSLPLG